MPCFHNGVRYSMGRFAAFTDDELPKGKDGAIRHFELIDEGGAIEPEEKIRVNRKREVK